MEATQQGASLHDAANAFLGLMDASENLPPVPDESKQEEADVQQEIENTAEEAATEPSTSDDVQIEASEEERTLPDTIDGIAEHLGVTKDDLLSLKVNTKIDGIEGQASLAELVKSYQLEGHLNQKSMQLAEMKKAAEAEIQQQKALLQQQIEQGSQLANYLNNELYKDYNAINWQELRETDPAEFAAKRQEFNERYQAIQNAQAQFNYQMQQRQQQEQAESEAKFKEILANERNALLSKLPDWHDKAKAESEQRQIREYLKAEGFGDSEINSLADHRSILVSRKAMLYDQLMKAKPVVEKKVQTLPKVIKPGTTKSKADINAERRKAQLGKLRKSGALHDAAALLLDFA